MFSLSDQCSDRVLYDMKVCVCCYYLNPQSVVTTITIKVADKMLRKAFFSFIGRLVTFYIMSLLNICGYTLR